MQMDGMIGHGEIGHAHAHFVPEPHRQRVDAGKDAVVPGPHVEIGHLRIEADMLAKTYGLTDATRFINLLSCLPLEL
jgi:hypothetical protein